LFGSGGPERIDLEARRLTVAASAAARRSSAREPAPSAMTVVRKSAPVQMSRHVGSLRLPGLRWPFDAASSLSGVTLSDRCEPCRSDVVVDLREPVASPPESRATSPAFS
jgi:hypothetical protein